MPQGSGWALAAPRATGRFTAALTVFERRCPARTSSGALSTAGDPAARERGDTPLVSSPPQVHNISLAEGETLTVESAAGLEPAVLANESFLLRGQVIRSPANLLTLRFQSPQPASPGSYRFHYQGTGRCRDCQHPAGCCLSPWGAPVGVAPICSTAIRAAAGLSRYADGEIISTRNYALIEHHQQHHRYARGWGRGLGAGSPCWCPEGGLSCPVTPPPAPSLPAELPLPIAARLRRRLGQQPAPRRGRPVPLRRRLPAAGRPPAHLPQRHPALLERPRAPVHG